jgi:hypothetical protein
VTPTRSRTQAAVLALLVFATGAAQAGTGNLYSVTSKMEIQGMPFSMPPRTTEVCGPKDTASEKMVPHDENCRVDDFRVVGNKSTFRMTCTGEMPMTATGEFERLANEGYRGTMRAKTQMEGQPMDMTMTFEGRKLRECDYATESPQAQANKMLAQSCGQMLAAPGNPYMLYESFVGPQAMCASDKAKFCGRVTPIAGDPAALRAAEQTDKAMRDAGGAGSLWQALQGCGLPRATVLTKACTSAEAKQDYAFIGDMCPASIARVCTKANPATAPEFVARHCPAQAAAAAKLHCVSRGFTADLGNPYSRFCNAWSTERLRGGRQDGTAPDPATAPEATPPAEEKKKSWRDRVRDVIGG